MYKLECCINKLSADESETLISNEVLLDSINTHAEAMRIAVERNIDTYELITTVYPEYKAETIIYYGANNEFVGLESKFFDQKITVIKY
jgi:hypothetical protein